MRSLISSVLIIFLPVIGNAVGLYDSKDCMMIGGQWTNAPAPARVGSCTLTQAYTVPPNERLEVGTSVDLVLGTNGVLSIDGELLIINTAAVLINSGSLRNNNYIDINNDGKLTLNSGGVRNTGVISSEGNITNNHTIPPGQATGGGIYNDNIITNYHGGEIHNYGRILSTGGASINTEQQATFRNYLGGHYNAGVDEITGRLVNQGYISVGRGLVINQGAILESAGYVSVGYGMLLGEKGSRITMLAGSSTSVGSTNQLRGEIIVNGEFTNAGDIWLSGTLKIISTMGDQLRGTNAPMINVSPGAIIVHGTGEINIQDNVFINNGGSSIVNNGRIALSCFSTFEDNGMYNGNGVSQQCIIPPVVPPTFPKWF